MPDAPANFDTMLVLVGGLGASQLGDIRDATRRPRLLVTELHDCGYLIGNLPDIVSHIMAMKTAYPGISRVVVVDHSMAWIVGKHAANAGLVDYLITLDPVGAPGIGHDVWPTWKGKPVAGEFWKANPTPFIAQLYVADGPAIITVDCSHNDLPHRPEVIAAVRAAQAGAMP